MLGHTGPCRGNLGTAVASKSALTFQNGVEPMVFQSQMEEPFCTTKLPNHLGAILGPPWGHLRPCWGSFGFNLASSS
eukprot:5374184-Pyramimonas_sp.AAC.1